jgi:cell division protein FtsI/penicillin-binding protein 2
MWGRYAPRVNERSASGRTPASVKRRRRSLAAAVLTLLLAVIVAALVTLLGGGASPAATLAATYARAWASRDWPALYAALDAGSRTSLSLARFSTIERHDADLATATGARVGGVSAVSGGRYSVALAVHTRIFGTLDEHLLLTIGGPTGTTGVHWSSTLEFPGLGPGERLHRVDSSPARGVLLARNGMPLSEVGAAANVIGSVGIASGALLEQTLAAGFPPATPVGLDGLELLFQDRLGGRPGGSLYAGRRLLASAPPQPGVNVHTSISPALQADAVSTLGSNLGAIVLMAPTTGEVLAAAGDPLTVLQPPGSTFKIVTLTALLKAHLAAPSTVYPYATSTVLDGFTLHNANGEDCGGTLANAFAVSCNSVFAPIGARLGASRLLAAADAYGFNSASPVSIAAESTIPPASLSDDLALGESAIGQAQVLASPLQMVRVAGTIALVGRRPVPTFAIVAPRRFPRVIPVAVARTIRSLMRDVVSYGTGVAAQIPGVIVAGKTGTAEVVTPVACGATGASGTTGTNGTSGATNGTVSGAASASVGSIARAAGPVAQSASVHVPAGTLARAGGRLTRGSLLVASAAPGTGGVSAPAGGTSATSVTGATIQGGGGPGTGGVNAPSGSGATSAAGGGATSATSSTGAGTSASGSTAAGGSTSASGSSASSGPTGATDCAGVDNNPYDTDAWFVAFAPEIHPRFVIAVLLPHDGAGGTTAAPLARELLEQALASGD